MNHKRIALVLCSLLFLAGLASATFPVWHGYLLTQTLNNDIEAFLETVPTTSGEPLQEADADPLRLAAEEYNRTIYAEKQQSFNGKTAYETPCFQLADYGYDSEIFAVIQIPQLDLDMPVYLGASPENLALGAAHLGQTSLPIGGESTNCVIAGHRGWRGAAYFKFIPSLRPGDEVQITNLWETLHYQVIEVRDIYSSDSDALLIRPGQDLITLMTCDYGTDGLKLRCLVICERSEG